jgi:hypothetical protein
VSSAIFVPLPSDTFVLMVAGSGVPMLLVLMNRPGMSGYLLVRKLSYGLGFLFSVVSGFQFCWWDVSAVLVEAVVVEPIDPFGGG